jgi:hypothetical protein
MCQHMHCALVLKLHTLKQCNAKCTRNQGFCLGHIILGGLLVVVALTFALGKVKIAQSISRVAEHIFGFTVCFVKDSE